MGYYILSSGLGAQVTETVVEEEKRTVIILIAQYLPSKCFTDAPQPSQPASNPGLIFQQDLVNITPAPAFPRLKGLDDRVSGDFIMTRGVLVLRVVAAAHIPAHQAQAQVHPAIARLQAILAALRTGGNLPDLVQVRAF